MNSLLENRCHTRQEIEEQVSYIYNEKVYSSRTINIGKGGIKLRTEEFIPPLTRITVFWAGDSAVTFTGLIVWSGRIESHFTAAVKFEKLTEEQAYFIEQLLASVSSVSSST